MKSHRGRAVESDRNSIESWDVIQFHYLYSFSAALYFIFKPNKNRAPQMTLANLFKVRN